MLMNHLYYLYCEQSVSFDLNFFGWLIFFLLVFSGALCVLVKVDVYLSSGFLYDGFFFHADIYISLCSKI